MTYAEKLKDPRWQKKRLEILERDGWACRMCGRDDQTLHVHHGYYEKGLQPWEYSNSTLWTLCAECHQSTERTKKVLHYYIGRIDPWELCAAGHYIRAIRDEKREVDRKFSEAVKKMHA